MVLGHTRCGAISATVDAFKKNAQFPGHIQSIATAILPAVRASASSKPAGTLIEAATKENIRRSVKTLQDATPFLATMVHEKTPKIELGRETCREGMCQYV